jgi:transposase InsO family protein
MWRGRLYVPDDRALRSDLLHEAHDAASSGHLGASRTLSRLSRCYFWSRMPEEVKEYVRTCMACLQAKASNQKPPGLMQPLPIPARRWEQVTMDLITGLPRTRRGHTAVVVWVDKLTKMAHMAACTDHVTAAQLAHLTYTEIVRHHGVPSSIVSDRDPRFTSNFWQSLWALLGTRLAMSTAYHPQTDGQTERMNRTLETMLRSYVNDTLSDWDDHLVACEIAINNAVQESTGYAPFYLNSGQLPNLPLDQAARVSVSSAGVNPSANSFVQSINESVERAKQRLLRAQQAQQRHADEHRRAVVYRQGDEVMLSTENLSTHNSKLRARWIGPFPIKRVVSEVVMELQLPAVMSRVHCRFHVDKLRQWCDDQGRFPTRRQVSRPLAEVVDGQREWEVERVLGERSVRGGREYLVLWQGYPIEDATWEPARHLTHAQRSIDEYRQQLVVVQQQQAVVQQQAVGVRQAVGGQQQV